MIQTNTLLFPDIFNDVPQGHNYGMAGIYVSGVAVGGVSKKKKPYELTHVVNTFKYPIVVKSKNQSKKYLQQPRSKKTGFQVGWQRK